jgi:segregation and condensation protein B
MLEDSQINKIVEAALLAADGPLTVAQIGNLFGADELDEANSSKQIREAITVLQTQSHERGVELKRVASGYRFQVRQELSGWVSRLWDEKPPRYTRALLETLALVAYKQPVTRGDIEQVRGVSVGQNIMRTLLEREWIKSVGHREVPGRPSLYATTKDFLDYFNLKSIDELPSLPEIRQLIEPVLAGETVPPGGQGIQDAQNPQRQAGGSEDVATDDETVDIEAVNIEALDVEAVSTEDSDPETDAGAIEIGSAEIASKETAEVVPLHPGVKPA